MTTTTQRHAAYDASRELAEALGQGTTTDPEVTLAEVAAQVRRERAAALRMAIADMAPKFIRVESRSRPGHFYQVAIALDGTLICSCPAAANHLKCWHLEEAKKLMTTDQALAIRPMTLVKREALTLSDKELANCRTEAALAWAGAVALPVELKTEAHVMAVMMYGLELGIPPMAALRHLYIVKGKVQPSTEVMAGMLMRSDPKAALICEKLEVQSGPNGQGVASGICTMRIIRPSRNIDQRLSVDWEQIKRAGLARDNNLAYPEDRLRYHCTKRLLRIYAPDIINNMEEEPSLDTLNARARMAIEGAPPELASEVDEEGDEPVDADYRDVLDRETGEIPLKAETPIAPTADQLQNVSRLINEIKESWGGASKDFLAMRDELLAKYGKEKLAQYSLLTYDEAAALLLYLRRKNGEPVDMPLDDEVPAGAS